MIQMRQIQWQNDKLVIESIMGQIRSICRAGVEGDWENIRYQPLGGNFQDFADKFFCSQAFLKSEGDQAFVAGLWLLI
jgi:hypothetical protein